MSFIYMLVGWVLTAIPFGLALVLPFLLLAWGQWLYRSPLAGVLALLLLFLVETIYVQLFALNLGVHTYPQDLLFVPMAAITGLRLLRPGAMRRLPWQLWAFTSMLLLSFVVGLAKSGSGAGVEFRNEFYFLVSFFYFASFEWRHEQIESLLKWLLRISLLIMLVAWARWVLDLAGLDWFDRVWALNDATGVQWRVLNSYQTFVLGLAMILLVYAQAGGKSLAGWLFMIPLLGLTVLLLQHRSVWVASFLPVFLAFVIVRRNQAQLLGRMLLVVGVTAVVLVPLLASGKFSGATDSVSDMASRATSTSSGTFVGRVDGWRSLLGEWQSGGPRTWLLGNPYGSGYERMAGPAGDKVTYSPHNYYVQLLLRSGVPGLLFFIALFVWLGRGAIRLAAEPHPGLNGYAMLGLLFALLLYYIPYAAAYPHGLLLGLMLSLQLQAGVHRREKAVRMPPPLVWQSGAHL